MVGKILSLLLGLYLVYEGVHAIFQRKTFYLGKYGWLVGKKSNVKVSGILAILLGTLWMLLGSLLLYKFFVSTVHPVSS